jgi:hypothetical protein
MRRLVGLFVALLAAGSAAAQEPTCVTACESKADTCAQQCEALAVAAYDDPVSLRECQLSCARALFVACVERCSATNEVVEDDYRLVAPDPDRIPPGTARAGEPSAEPDATRPAESAKTEPPKAPAKARSAGER